MQEQLRGITEELVLPEGEELFEEEGIGVSTQIAVNTIHFVALIL